MKKVKYHLRFQVIPGKNVTDNARRLADFCVKHNIEEVVLFFAAEEWNNGLLSEKEEDMWFATVRDSKKILERRGISVSLNPWMTVLHCDRGRFFPPGRRFRPMVSPTGEKCRACASFADTNWQKYIYNLYGRFATLGFRVIWVEDDFRYHNHGPLTWGGGFEDEMCERFSRRIGKRVTRREILKKILRKGKPHPWRSRWMEVWRETQLEVARGIAESVGRNSQRKTKLGLMSSYLPVHSIEGRRWLDLFRALSIEGDVAHRPNFANYAEDIGKNQAHSIMTLDMQKKLRPASFEVAPEIENFPFTVWNKSDTSTWMNMVFALLFGSDALLLDLFPMLGNRVDEEPRIGALLDKSAESLSWVSSNFSREHNLSGIGIPWKENASEKTWTEKGESMDELKVDVSPAWNFLLSCGIPACHGEQDVNVIFGNSAWTFEDDEIYGMLKGGLMIDGLSAEILIKRGFGRYLGIRYKDTLEREKSTYSVEVVNNEESGLRKGFYFSVNKMEQLRVFEPSEGAATWSDIITPENERIGAGTMLYENCLGGRTVVFAVEDPAKLVLNFQRQTMVHNMIRYLYGGKIPFPLVTGAPYLLPMCFKGKREMNLVVFNGATDPATVSVKTSGKTLPSRQTTVLKPLEQPSSGKLLKGGKGETAGLWKTESRIPYMSFVIVRFQKNKS